MAFVDLGPAVYSNGSATLAGTEGGADVLVSLSGNEGGLGTNVGGLSGMAVGKGSGLTLSQDDPIAMLAAPSRRLK